MATERGLWAIRWSCAGLLATALLQAAIVVLSGSVALLADTIHNFGDAATAIPMWIAFRLARRPPTKRFPYGYGRVEELAGVVVIVAIFLSAVMAGWTSLDRLLHPQPVMKLWLVVAAAVIGFLGNEAVAIFRMKVGREIGSAALIADGYHARVDGLTSLAVLFGAVGVWLGYPLADPIVGLLITLVILWMLWKSGTLVFARLLDRVDPEVIDEITQTVHHASGVREVTEVRVRWIGHRLHAELNIAVDAQLSVDQGHEIAKEVQHQILHDVSYLTSATIHVDPRHASGERHHRIGEHQHDDFPEHSH